MSNADILVLVKASISNAYFQGRSTIFGWDIITIEFFLESISL